MGSTQSRTADLISQMGWELPPLAEDLYHTGLVQYLKSTSLEVILPGHAPQNDYSMGDRKPAMYPRPNFCWEAYKMHLALIGPSTACKKQFTDFLPQVASVFRGAPCRLGPGREAVPHYFFDEELHRVVLWELPEISWKQHCEDYIRELGLLYIDCVFMLFSEKYTLSDIYCKLCVAMALHGIPFFVLCTQTSDELDDKAIKKLQASFQSKDVQVRMFNPSKPLLTMEPLICDFFKEVSWSRGKGANAERISAASETVLGATVRLKELEKKPELNGRCGVCIGFEKDKDRYIIRLINSGVETDIALRHTNFSILKPKLLGAMVRLKGLVSKPELNGRYALVDEFLRENERYRVFLPDSPGEGLALALKSENLERVESWADAVPVPRASPVQPKAVAPAAAPKPASVVAPKPAAVNSSPAGPAKASSALPSSNGEQRARRGGAFDRFASEVAPGSAPPGGYPGTAEPSEPAAWTRPDDRSSKSNIYSTILSTPKADIEEPIPTSVAKSKRSGAFDRFRSEVTPENGSALPGTGPAPPVQESLAPKPAGAPLPRAPVESIAAPSSSSARSRGGAFGKFASDVTVSKPSGAPPRAEEPLIAPADGTEDASPSNASRGRAFSRASQEAVPKARSPLEMPPQTLPRVEIRELPRREPPREKPQQPKASPEKAEDVDDFLAALLPKVGVEETEGISDLMSRISAAEEEETQPVSHVRRPESTSRPTHAQPSRPPVSRKEVLDRRIWAVVGKPLVAEAVIDHLMDCGKTVFGVGEGEHFSSTANLDEDPSLPRAEVLAFVDEEPDVVLAALPDAVRLRVSGIILHPGVKTYGDKVLQRCMDAGLTVHGADVLQDVELG